MHLLHHYAQTPLLSNSAAKAVLQAGLICMHSCLEVVKVW